MPLIQPYAYYESIYTMKMVVNEYTIWTTINALQLNVRKGTMITCLYKTGTKTMAFNPISILFQVSNTQRVI